jgi:RNA polymerase sigma-70 factor (ECF subfamily)
LSPANVRFFLACASSELATVSDTSSSGRSDDLDERQRFAAIVQAARDGDEQAWGELIGECRDYLLLIANADLDRGLQAKFGASDFVQQTMLAAHQHLAQFRGQTSEEFRGWLRQILINDVYRVRRQFFAAQQRDVGRELRIDDSQIGQPPLFDGQCTPGTDAVTREQARALQIAMAQLPEDYQRVIRLREWDELSFPDIGQRMNLSEDAARKLWRRAIVKLESMLQPVIGLDFASDAPRSNRADDEQVP